MGSGDIIVISHRRSGTHLTINFIMNNMTRSLKFVTVVHPGQKFTYDKRKNYIVKTHFDFENFSINEFNKCFLTTDDANCAYDVFNESSKVFVCRNPVDTMKSMYYYNKHFNEEVQKMTIEQYIKETDVLGEWVKFINHFIERKDEYSLLVVSYDEIVKTPEKIVQKLSKHLKCEKRHAVMKHDNHRFDKPAKPVLKNKTQKTPLSKNIIQYIIDYVIQNLDYKVKDILKDIKGFEFLKKRRL